MSRRLVSFITAMLFLCVFAFTAAAEEGEPEETGNPATPTDLECLHPETRMVIYFFDSPFYTPIDGSAHRVEGPAMVETVCVFCGEVLSSETVDSAEETRPHTLKNGTCLLCGWKRSGTEQTKAWEHPQQDDLPGERTIFLTEETGVGVCALTLTGDDLGGLYGESVQILLIREAGGVAAIALKVQDVLIAAERHDAVLSVEMAEREDGSVFAALRLVSGSAGTEEVAADCAALRFYGARGAADICIASAMEDDLTETKGTWREPPAPGAQGYLTVPYLTEGTYMLRK